MIDTITILVSMAKKHRCIKQNENISIGGSNFPDG